MSRKEKKLEKQEAKMAKKEAKQEKKAKQVANEPASTEKPPKKRHVGRNILIVIIIIIIIGFVSCIASSSGSDDDTTPDTSSSTETSAEDEISDEVALQALEYCEDLRAGYLGDYRYVEIQDVFEYNYPDGEWKCGTFSDGVSYLIEFTDDENIQVQFKINEDEEDGDYDFSITGFRNPSESDEDYSATEAVATIHSWYEAYAEANDNTGIEDVYYDESDTTVMYGYFGPVEEYVATTEETDDENPTEEDTTSVEMTDEEISAALADTYDIDIDTMRERLYEGDLATYTEDEVAAMSNYECYVAYVTAAAEYDVATGVVDEEAAYPYITTPDEYVDWFRTAEVGDVIDIESAKIVSIDHNLSIYCSLHEYGSGVKHDSAYFVVRLEDTSMYFNEDVVSMRVTYLGVNKGNVAVFECQTIGIQNY